MRAIPKSECFCSEVPSLRGTISRLWFLKEATLSVIVFSQVECHTQGVSSNFPDRLKMPHSHLKSYDQAVKDVWIRYIVKNQFHCSWIVWEDYLPNCLVCVEQHFIACLLTCFTLYAFSMVLWYIGWKGLLVIWWAAYTAMAMFWLMKLIDVRPG